MADMNLIMSAYSFLLFRFLGLGINGKPLESTVYSQC